MAKIKKTAAGLALLVLFNIVGRMDYEDEEAQHKYCLGMVDQGAWPAEVCK